MEHKHIRFPAAGLSFEGILSIPNVTPPTMGGILCHPHPLRGGNMDNHVIVQLAAEFDQARIANLRFNFRGVGNSEGSYTEGDLEHNEIIGAQHFLKTYEGLNIEESFLVGYSFGSRVILKHPESWEGSTKIVLISPQNEAVINSCLHSTNIPVLIISGSRDHICSINELSEVLETKYSNAKAVEVQGADHFWVGHEAELTRHIIAFLTR